MEDKKQVKCPWCNTVFWYRTEDMRNYHTRVSGGCVMSGTLARVWCPACGAWVTAEKDLKPVERKPHILNRIFKNR